MEAKNLAIVFGPTLIRKADNNMGAMFTDMSDHCKIIESIVLHVSIDMQEHKRWTLVSEIFACAYSS